MGDETTSASNLTSTCSSNATSTKSDTTTDNSISMKLTCYGIQKRFPNVPQLSTSQFAEWLSSGQPVTLLDARPEEEYNVSRLEGAVRVDYDKPEDFLSKVDELVKSTPKDQPIVCYCSVGYRSSLVADRIMNQWKSDGGESCVRPIYNLEGSIFKWANENRPIVDLSSTPAHFVHPYNAVFGKLLESSRRYYPE